MGAQNTGSFDNQTTKLGFDSKYEDIWSQKSEKNDDNLHGDKSTTFTQMPFNFTDQDHKDIFILEQNDQSEATAMYSKWHPSQALNEMENDRDAFTKKGKRLQSRRDQRQELKNRYKTTRQKRQDVEKSQKIRRKEEIAMKKKERVWELGEAPLDAYEDQKPSIEENFMAPTQDDASSQAKSVVYFKKGHQLDNWSKRLEKMQRKHRYKARANQRLKSQGLSELKGLNLNHPQMFFSSEKKLPWEKAYENELQPIQKRHRITKEVDQIRRESDKKIKLERKQRRIFKDSTNWDMLKKRDFNKDNSTPVDELAQQSKATIQENAQLDWDWDLVKNDLSMIRKERMKQQSLERRTMRTLKEKKNWRHYHLNEQLQEQQILQKDGMLQDEPTENLNKYSYMLNQDGSYKQPKDFMDQLAIHMHQNIAKAHEGKTENEIKQLHQCQNISCASNTNLLTEKHYQQNQEPSSMFYEDFHQYELTTSC